MKKNNLIKISKYPYRFDERKSEQAHILHAPTLLENAVYNEWQFQALATGNRTKKGYKLLLKRIKSAFPSTHYVLHTYKVSRNSFERFQRSCANKKNRSIFHFGQICKFKKGVTPRKKVESKFPMDMHIYTLCPS